MYGSHAHAYYDRGWLPIPVLPGEKFPTAPGVTGRYPALTEKDVARLVSTYAGWNIAVRVPPVVVGIDVDAYPPKHGGETLRAWSDRCGELPPTWRTSSRGPGVSGISFFSVGTPVSWPAELHAVQPSGVITAHIDIIHFGYRHAMVPPSGVEGRAYQWYDPDGRPTTDIPCVWDLPAMPMMWVEGVRAQPRARRKNTRPHRTRSAGKQVTQTPDPAALARALEHIRTGTGVQLRRQAGLSTAELAAELRIPEPKARHLEQGQLRRPRKAWLQRYDALLRGLAAPQQQDAQVDPQ